MISHLSLKLKMRQKLYLAAELFQMISIQMFIIAKLLKNNIPFPLETRTTRTPAFWGYPPPPHDYPYHWVILDPKSKEDKVKVTNFKKFPKFQIFEFRNGHYTRHIFWSCLIRCANMKWIRWVLLKIQSGHDSVHRRTDGWTDRRTDGQGDTSIPPFQLRWSGGYNKRNVTNVYYCMFHQLTDHKCPVQQSLILPNP